MSINEQMQAAKAYIQDGQYDKARKILKRIEHPTAEKWLERLDTIDPPPKYNSPKNLIIAWSQMAISAFFAWVVAGIFDSLEYITHANDNVVLLVWVVSFALIFFLVWKLTNQLKKG